MPLWNWRPPALRTRVGIRVLPSGMSMSIGTPEAMVQIGESSKRRGCGVSGEDETVALMCRRWPVFTAKVVRVNWTNIEGNLVVVGLVECLRKGVRDIQLCAIAKLSLCRDEQRVVVRVHAGLDVIDSVRTTGDWIEDGANLPSEEEVRTKVMETVKPQRRLGTEIPLDTGIELLHHAIASTVIDDVDSRRACAGNHWAGERIA